MKDEILFISGEYIFKSSLDVATYNAFRSLVGWCTLPDDEALSGIEHTYLLISCYKGNQIVGFARLLWDHGYVAYISDVIVHPDYQGHGIGRQMVTWLVKEMQAQIKPGWKIKISLMAATGKEPFYEKLGFQRRPNEFSGAGLDLWIG